MRQVQRWLPVALFLLAAGARAETIRGVEFRGLRLLAEETVRYYLGLVDGQELDEAALNRSIEDLWRRNLVDDLKIERLAADGGVKLIVTVAERPILRSLDFKGLKRLSRTDITERITKESISVREGSPISLGEVKRLQTTIEEMYREKGFRFAKAEFLLEEVAPTERGSVFLGLTIGCARCHDHKTDPITQRDYYALGSFFSIDEAEKVRIGDIKFADNTIYGDWRLKWAMSKTKETNLLWRVLKRDIYNPATIAEDMVKVKDLYRGAGYKNVLRSRSSASRRRRAASGVSRSRFRWSRATASSSARSRSKAIRSSTRPSSPRSSRAPAAAGCARPW